MRQGPTLGEITKGIQAAIPHRTLQRRLESLRKAGIVTASGDTRSTRYHLEEKEALDEERAKGKMARAFRKI